MSQFSTIINAHLEETFTLERDELLPPGPQQESHAFVTDSNVNIEEVAECDAGYFRLVLARRTVLINYLAQLQNFFENVDCSLATTDVRLGTGGWPV